MLRAAERKEIAQTTTALPPAIGAERHQYDRDASTTMQC